MAILVFLETVIGGAAFLGSLMLALLKNLHPERTGLINRWHYFFWHFWIPRLIPWTSGNPYSLPCQNSHAMKVLLVLSFTPIRLPCRQAILAAERNLTSASYGVEREWSAGLNSCFYPGYRSKE